MESAKFSSRHESRTLASRPLSHKATTEQKTPSAIDPEGVFFAHKISAITPRKA